ncbi:MAG: helix-hairpin-helix domain-containing protein, partial [Bacteroidales bacterium]|nr:helix-hairpin-helix domain-containing protein [Bacteroidales bacterium]
MCKTLGLYIFLCFPFVLQAQEIQDKVRMLVEDYVSQNEEGNIDAELLYETFYEFYENPININKADADKMDKIPFLSPHQVNALVDYIKRHGEVQTIY